MLLLLQKKSHKTMLAQSVTSLADFRVEASSGTQRYNRMYFYAFT